MALLKNYEDFIERINELGFMPFSNILPGFNSLPEETPKENWHTGDIDTDPWCWKDRAAEEKKLAFGCILGGNKGFVSERMYHVFYRAYRPKESMEERRASGYVSQMTWQLWKLFETKTLLDTGTIRKDMNVSKKKGSSLDNAIKELQQYYYITVAGNRRKIDRMGNPYGWPANTYDWVSNWAPEEWLKGVNEISSDEAREEILKKGISNCKGIDYMMLAKVLKLN